MQSNAAVALATDRAGTICTPMPAGGLGAGISRGFPSLLRRRLVGRTSRASSSNRGAGRRRRLNRNVIGNYS